MAWAGGNGGHGGGREFTGEQIVNSRENIPARQDGYTSKIAWAGGSGGHGGGRPVAGKEKGC